MFKKFNVNYIKFKIWGIKFKYYSFMFKVFKKRKYLIESIIYLDKRFYLCKDMLNH